MPTNIGGVPGLPARVVALRRWCSLRLLVLLVAMTATASCGGCSTPPWYTVPTINKQTPTSMTITPSPMMTPGSTTTFTLTITYPNPISTTNAFYVKAAIFEDDLGDVRLDRSVNVSFPANATTGTATFTLSCVDDGAGNLSIKGDDGSNTYDEVWEIFAWIPDQETSNDIESPNTNVSCRREQ